MSIARRDRRIRKLQFCKILLDNKKRRTNVQKLALKEKQYMQCTTMQLCWQQNYGKVKKYAGRYKKCYFNCTPNSQETFLQLDDEPICYSLIFQSWHIHLLPVLIKTRDHDRLYQRYSVIKNLNHVYCLGSQQSLKNLLVLNKYLTTNPFTLVMQGSYYFKKFTPWSKSSSIDDAKHFTLKFIFCWIWILA